MDSQELEELRRELLTLLETMPEADRNRLESESLEAHQYLLELREGNLRSSRDTPPEQLLLLHSILNGDPDGLLADLAAMRSPSDSSEGTEDSAKAAIVRHDGAIAFGGVRYDLTDIGWLTCFLAWHYTRHHQPDFSEHPQVNEIGDATRLAIFGDWGGNNAAAKDVAAAVKSREVDYLVHLGDVYYNGYSEDGRTIKDYQRRNLLDPWPGSEENSFNLNSNHDMYARGTGYFDVALVENFSAQSGSSYFCLHNASFRLVGLDTAYFAPDRGPAGFMKGALNRGQEQFLAAQAAEAASSKQHLIVLTHHNGLSLDGARTTSLWDQVTRQLDPLAGKSVTWYWGHEHAAVVYAPRAAGSVNVLPRCCGHGCIPWGVASDLEKGLRAGRVTWFEKTVLGPGTNYFVTNGFALLDLDRSTETIFGRDAEGGEWSAHWHQTLSTGC